MSAHTTGLCSDCSNLGHKDGLGNHEFTTTETMAPPPPPSLTVVVLGRTPVRLVHLRTQRNELPLLIRKDHLVTLQVITRVLRSQRGAAMFSPLFFAFFSLVHAVQIAHADPQRSSCHAPGRHVCPVS